MLFRDKRKIQVQDLTRIAICVAFCCVTAYIVVPAPIMPGGVLTALTVALTLMAFVLPPRQTFLAVFVYVFLGCIGLPVFVGGSSGVARLFGPTGGFIFSWFLAYPLISYFKGSIPNFRRYALVSVLVTIPVTYAGSMISLMLVMDLNLKQAFWLGVVPYVAGDVLKCLLAAFLGVRIHKALERR